MGSQERGWRIRDCGALNKVAEFIALVCLIAAIAACSSSGGEPLIKITPTATPSPAPATRTATPILSPTPTATASPTATPTATPPPSISLTPGQLAALGRTLYFMSSLASGKVLIVGGLDINATALATAEVFDP